MALKKNKIASIALRINPNVDAHTHKYITTGLEENKFGINPYEFETVIVKLKTLLADKALVIAVGAGHLPGEKGLINLLRKEGYTVTPVENKNGGVREI